MAIGLTSILGWVDIMAIIFVLLGIFNLVGVFGGGKVGEKVAGWVGQKAGEKGPEAVKGLKETPGKVKGWFKRAPERTLSAFIRDKKELKKIEKIDADLLKIEEEIDKVINQNQFNNAGEANLLKNLFVTLGDDIKDAHNYFRRIRRTTYRQESGMDKLMDALKKEGKNVDRLEIFEKSLLTEHADAKNALEEANKELANIKKYSDDLFNKIAAFSTWPRVLRTNRISVQGTTAHIEKHLIEIKNQVASDIAPKIKAANDNQDKALKILEGIIIESKKLAEE
jgi:hypothetical protein